MSETTFERKSIKDRIMKDEKGVITLSATDPKQMANIDKMTLD